MTRRPCTGRLPPMSTTTEIATARANLESLIAEVEGEIEEARELERQGKAQGTTADWDKLEDLLGRAGSAAD